MRPDLMAARPGKPDPLHTALLLHHGGQRGCMWRWVTASSSKRLDRVTGGLIYRLRVVEAPSSSPMAPERQLELGRWTDNGSTSSRSVRPRSGPVWAFSFFFVYFNPLMKAGKQTASFNPPFTATFNWRRFVCPPCKINFACLG